MTQQAIIYARYSTMEQSKGYSLERQLTQGRAFAAARGWSVESEISDEGRSAFHGANRAEGSKLRRFEIEAADGLHKGKVLCVENIDRLSRQGAKAAAKLIWAINEAGVDVATWHDGIIYRADSDGDMMELFSVIIKAQLAYEESAKKSQRTRASWAKRYQDISEGRRETRGSQSPAWIEASDDGYVLIEHRAHVLNEVYDLYLAGVGTYRIVQMLNERGEPAWPNKRGAEGGWYLGYVHRLLTSRAVLGEYVTLKGRTISASHYPQAVSAEKFARAQVVREGRQRTGGRDSSRANNLLSGLARCSCCLGSAGYENKGENSVTRWTNKAGEKVEYRRKHYERLRCDNNRRRKGCQNTQLLDYKVVERAVLDQLLALTIDDDAADPCLVRLDEQIAEQQRLI